MLHAADGWSNNAIANELGVTRTSVIEWRRRFAAEGLEALGKVRPGRGRPRSISAAMVTKIVQLTVNTVPKGATHWSCRSMAAQVGVSPASVQRVWHEHRLYPHRVSAFKVSKDPQFLEKLTDVVGLYMNPPERAVVFSFDEKTQTDPATQFSPDGFRYRIDLCSRRAATYRTQ